MKIFYNLVSFLIISLSGSVAHAQQDHDPGPLYALRRQQANAGQDYSETELQIAALGAYPKALVTMPASETGKSFVFRTYKNITADKQDRIEQRLMTSIPGIQSVQIENQNVSVSFSAQAKEEDIAVFFRILGYTGYEIK